MITATWDQIAIESTRRRLEQFNSKVRRQVLLKVGNAAAKPLVSEMKAAVANEVPEVSGQLRRSIGKRVKAYAGANRVFVIVGPKSRKVQISQYDYYRKTKAAQGRKRYGERIAKVKYLNPAKYAHLAGPHRHSAFVQKVRQRMKSTTFDNVSRVLAEEVSKL